MTMPNIIFSNLQVSHVDSLIIFSTIVSVGIFPLGQVPAWHAYVLRTATKQCPNGAHHSNEPEIDNQWQTHDIISWGDNILRKTRAKYEVSFKILKIQGLLNK